ncbi:hypothetical protein, partial [Coleofasciculus sp.]|uniref:hypothetical protein n=1 Tax=Coleofasciculus sp. TaxID=3100458 RepID=UPI003A1AA93A
SKPFGDRLTASDRLYFGLKHPFIGTGGVLMSLPHFPCLLFVPDFLSESCSFVKYCCLHPEVTTVSPTIEVSSKSN